MLMQIAKSNDIKMQNLRYLQKKKSNGAGDYVAKASFQMLNHIYTKTDQKTLGEKSGRKMNYLVSSKVT